MLVKGGPGIQLLVKQIVINKKGVTRKGFAETIMSLLWLWHTVHQIYKVSRNASAAYNHINYCNVINRYHAHLRTITLMNSANNKKVLSKMSIELATGR